MASCAAAGKQRGMNRLRLLLAALFALALGIAGPVQAKVVVSFYSHDFGERFPHAFVTLKGRVDATGQAVDYNYGFTARTVSPAILFGAVKGYVQTKEAKYIAGSDKQFSVTVDDATYGRLLDRVRAWQDARQPSYDLGTRNCIHFVMELAEIVGLKVNRQSQFFKKPKSFLLEVKELNPGLD